MRCTETDRNLYKTNEICTAYFNRFFSSYHIKGDLLYFLFAPLFFLVCLLAAYLSFLSLSVIASVLWAVFPRYKAK